MFPTNYLSFAGSYRAKDTACSDDRFIQDQSLLPIGTVPVPADDPNGLGFDIWTYFYDQSIPVNSLPREVRTCEIRCNQQAVGDDQGSVLGPTVALTATYVTTTQKTTSRGNAVTSAAPGQSQRPPPSPTQSAQTSRPSGVATPPKPEPSSSEQAVQTGGGRVTTTDEHGSTIIVQGSPGSPGSPGGPGIGSSEQVTFTDANGHTVVVQGATTAAPGQAITTTDENGSVYTTVIEGVTVTNTEGLVIVIEGGTTGTLAVAGTSTVLVQGSATLSNWDESSTIAASSIGPPASLGMASRPESDLDAGIWALILILTVSLTLML